VSPEPCTPIDPGPVQSVCQPPYQDLGVSAGFGAGESQDSSLGVPAPTAAGPSNAGKDNATTATGGAVVGDGGCQVGHGPVDASAGVWFGLFGLGIFARRRRSQARS
jgi:MYXO-CTERM domain-containing protein